MDGDTQHSRMLWFDSAVGSASARAGTLARLAAKYGAEITMPGLLDRLAHDCPYRVDRKPRKYSANCVARFVDLDDPRPPPDFPPAAGARK